MSRRELAADLFTPHGPARAQVVVHGATGFTGRLVVEYLMARYPNGGNDANLRWAMGGRNADKLAAVLVAAGLAVLALVFAIDHRGRIRLLPHRAHLAADLVVADPNVPEQRVSFGTSGHRGSSLKDRKSVV